MVVDERRFLMEMGGVRKKRTMLSQAVAYWRAKDYVAGEQILINKKTPGTHDAMLGSTSGVDTNDPTFLDYTGTKYAYLPGSGSNNPTTPDSAALSIVGDLDIRCAAALDDWTPAAVGALGGKWDTVGNQRSYRFDVQTTGRLQLVWSTDGITATTVTSTVAPAIADGALLLVRATLDVDNGAVGNDVRFYTKASTEANAAADLLSNAGWVQLGDTVTTALTTSIFDSTASVAVGNSANGVVPLAGKFYAFVVKNGINGTTALDWSANGAAEPFATQVATSGQTMTFNRSATGKKLAVVDRKMFLFGTDDYFEIPDHADLDFAASDSFTVAVAYRVYGTTTNQVLISKRDSSAGFASAWNVNRGIAANAARFDIWDGAGSVSDQADSAVSVGVASTAIGVRDVTADTIAAFKNGTSTAATADTTTGTLTNANVVRIGSNANAGGANFLDGEFIAAAIFRKALSAAEAAKLHTELLA